MNTMPKGILYRWCYRELILCVFLVLPAAGCEKEHKPDQKPFHTKSTPETKPYKILLVQSYHQGYPWEDAIARGVRMALSESNVDLQTFYMDTKRKTSESWKQQAGRDARKVVADWKPDVVIAADDNAQEYFAKDYAGKPTPQFVFCGVNLKPEVYGYPAANITGILEQPHLEKTLEYLEKIKPGIRKLFILSDNTSTSAGAIEYMKPPAPYVVVSEKLVSTFEEWKQAVLEAQKTADALLVYSYYSIQRNPGEDSMDASEVMSWTEKHCTLPIVGFLVFSVDDGALCGYMESGVEHGLKAGQMALEILHGKAAVELPIIIAEKGQTMLNLNTARKRGIVVPEEVIKKTDVVIGK